MIYSQCKRRAIECTYASEMRCRYRRPKIIRENISTDSGSRPLATAQTVTQITQSPDLSAISLTLTPTHDMIAVDSGSGSLAIQQNEDLMGVPTIEASVDGGSSGLPVQQDDNLMAIATIEASASPLGSSYT